ncbi:MAG: 50S ribosomal protein L10 [bacterium (Candidatus Ratteibacteria) CG_4_10_14_3_um_filter_41_18]|uniref:Large ribosomal subunit protein uL10 n=4 Tax=Candidatus Ratteibacteria TaxID=2979319 RepID=A0A2M7YEL4_9BACT|nr:MAG: 50S ribosomal protein L10 [Candidatus Omnitrophica bacterium CG1_02_41_171]PIV64158.1 MAG: 50S ribosomal protein L10 [bacterium (Candidatus Ratteibacteria) CG01_land_8_20_14_3_00_40_19]PIW31044.1 MAG: 50S ribosomal protein L10 [bacterium (Candidatus Ratteibacteria) CG15_BIG_FIL_POST_REV_8_21_14_020_41_12]PIW74208.1 MAG: 50S ribosomal protein L10 [bacterium (Candidatus Ratteibacteria) CG_4_8_14_3_um_filter_41_36]PIX76717.1 MAG: 50S ribosomal protein L10 [bacterium (Candidatus Ratteibacte
MPRKENEKKVLELTKIFEDANISLLINFSSLSVPQVTNLRQRLKEKGGNCKVVKKNLTLIALKKLYLENFVPHLENLNEVIGFVLTDEENVQEIAKILTSFEKEFESFKIKAGYHRGRIFSSGEIQSLAKLPSREVLKAKLVGMLSLPLVRFLNLLQAPVYNFIKVLNNIKKKK